MTKSNKKLIIPGCILILSLIFGVLISGIEYSNGHYQYAFSFSSFTGYLVLVLPLTLYCFIFSKTRLSAISYIISMAIPILIMALLALSELSYYGNDFSPVYALLSYLLSWVIALIVKFNHSQIRKFLGISMVSLMVLATIFLIISNVHRDIVINLVGNMFFVSLDISIAIISLTDSEKIAFKKSTILKNELLALKTQYDNGNISEEEYKQKKEKLINKL